MAERSATRPGRARRATRLGAMVTVPVVAATLALVHPGAHVTQVDLNDASVWLTNTSQSKLGRWNSQVDELNGGLVADSTEMDVVQDARDVLLLEPGLVSVVDPASVALGAQAVVPHGSAVSMADGVVSVVSPAGDVWVRAAGDVGTIVPDEPDLELGEGAVAVVARDGSGAVLTATTAGEVERHTLADTGLVSARLGDLGLPRPVQDYEGVTAVGGLLVVLDGTVVRSLAGSTDLSRQGAELVLQQPGPHADRVLVATPAALLEVPVSGGEVRERAGAGAVPAAPVRVGDCVHAAWASATGSYLRVCGGGDVERLDLQGMTTSDRLVFRVNRDVVVLNDTVRGRLWVPLEDPLLREPNWQDIEPEDEPDETDAETDSRDSSHNLQAECTASSGSPSAVDDEYGVRPGFTTVLSVIDNDGAPDCGILTISEFDPIPAAFGTLVPVHGRRALQLEVAPAASGSVTFTYTITDGRGSSAPSTATVTLTARPASANGPPEQMRVGAVLVEQGASVTYDVLTDFRDPDGDHLVLVGATVETTDAVRTRPDGELTFRSAGETLGRQSVRVLVSDGTEVAEGTVNVDVRPAGSLAPVIDPVHAETYVDRPVVVRPLLSVRSAGREPVRLAGVEEQPGVTVEPDLVRGTFTFTARTPGTYYVPFVVTAPPQQATGLARIDVREQPEEPEPPVAVLDVALLPPDGEVTIDPLANDVDPGGAVLVVQSVDVPPGTGVQAAVLNHQLVRFSSTRAVTEPVVVRYTISNGTAQATGTILVQPAPPGLGQQPPVVPDVTATVRTGGVVTIPVLQDAYDPDGEAITLLPDLVEPLGPDQGLLFVSGDTLRYQAPDRPMDVSAVFEVRDEAGNRASATVRVSVHDSDPASKPPPRPRNLTARVFEGETVRIQVPLVGIDRDGDGVYLLGEDTAPQFGRIVARGADWLEYESYRGRLGTDTFTYAVEDWVGRRAVATVRVGVVPRPTTISAQVIARNDDVVVRPGQRVEVRVLRNDSDTGGGELTLEPDLVADEGVDAHVEGRRVVVQTPPTPTVQQITYTATNERGGRASAVLTVTVTEDAEFQPPVARDVVVPAIDTINRSSVEVDVLEVADNPSGSIADLAVSVHPSAADVATVTERGTVLVQLVDHAQTLPYLLTNTHPQADGVSSYAFITVPALGDFPPVPRPGAPELRVIAGEELLIPIEEHVQVAPGRQARVQDVARVSATNSDGSSLVADPRTLRFVAARGYAGPASITVEVTDGAPSDTSARRSVITLPITVLAAEAHPPTFTPSVLDVGPGERTRVDLTALTSAPVATPTGTTQYRYRITSAVPPGFDVRLDGTVLTVAAGPSTPRGTVGGVAIEIDYGGRTPLPVQVEFRVVASSRALARVVDHVIPDGVEGRATTVAVLRDASNPFPGEPLSVVSAVVESGDGETGVEGTDVWVRPRAGFIGTLVVRYRVQDVTRDPDRQVEGRIRLTVRGRPAAPGVPRVDQVRDRAVVLAWDAPVANGEPITEYRVTVSPGGATRTCLSTTCTIDGLTNDVEHRFTVAARNAVGWSDESPSSAAARPDAVPAAPGAPSLAFDDGALVASWSAPESTGSPVTGYTVEVSPATNGGQTSFSTSSTSLRIGNLSNGTRYEVRVRAQNRAPEPGPWSPWASEVPARVPDAPAVSATRTENELGRQIRVTWTPGSTGGDPISSYELRIDGPDGQRVVSGLTGTSHVLDNARNGVEYAFEVRARNKAGQGPAGTARAFAFGVPFRPVVGDPIASAGTEAGKGTVTFSWTADGNGSAVTRHLLRVGSDAPVEIGPAMTYTLTGLTGGRAVTASVAACNLAGCGEYSPTVSAVPLTRPAAVRDLLLDPPEFDGSRWPSSITARWAEPADWGGGTGREYVVQFYRGDQPVGPARRTQDRTATLELPRAWFFLGASATITVDVRAATNQGQAPVVTASRTVAVEPPGPVRVLELEVLGDGSPGTPVDAVWSPPAPNGGPAVNHYLVRFAVGGAQNYVTDWLRPTGTRQALPGGVTGPTTVYVEVKAVNDVGESVARASAPVPEPPEGDSP